ncbi:unnamed protein product [Durusdinium trenchii]|uniref:Uncharacterized protein n=2 Tax=Durusdinium trenchii TaxID=1381693 RepID=A0ABP0IHR5_9DINO
MTGNQENLDSILQDVGLVHRSGEGIGLVGRGWNKKLYFPRPDLIKLTAGLCLHSDLSVAPRVESGSQGSLRLLVSVLTHGCDYSLCTQTGFNISDCRASDFVTFSTVRQIQKYCLCLTLQSWKANC